MTYCINLDDVICCRFVPYFQNMGKHVSLFEMLRDCLVFALNTCLLDSLLRILNRSKNGYSVEELWNWVKIKRIKEIINNKRIWICATAWITLRQSVPNVRKLKYFLPHATDCSTHNSYITENGSIFSLFATKKYFSVGAYSLVLTLP